MSGACSEIIDDIEDLIESQDITPKQRYSSKKNVNVRSRRRPVCTNDSPPEHALPPGDLHLINSLPGRGTVYVKTWGCTHNTSDSEYMAGQLSAYGYTLTPDKWSAQLWLLNSCTVKNPAEDHLRNEIELGLKSNRRVVVAGCVSQGAPRAAWLQGLSVVGVQQIDRIVEVVEETLKGNTVRLLGQKKTSEGHRAGGASLLLPKVRRNPLVEIISINTGCLNQCTYCKTKHARGELASYPPQEILQRAQQSFQEGVCEIWLTSEDTGTYGRDIGTSLPELLRELVQVIPEGCRLRLGMTNPPYILEHLHQIAEIMHHPRVYKFLHVPAQSGSDAVLADMKREYTRQDFQHLVDFLTDKVPGITIATDIICGFPTEAEADFAETMSLCAGNKFPSLFINQFYPRPGTPAALLPRLNPKLVKTRTKALTELFHSYAPYAGREGAEYDVLVTDVSHDNNFYVAHNEFYEQVLVPKQEELMGKMVRVCITRVSRFSMEGRPLGRQTRPGLAPPLPAGVVSGLTRTKHTRGHNIPIAVCALLAAFLFRVIWIFI